MHAQIFNTFGKWIAVMDFGEDVLEYVGVDAKCVKKPIHINNYVRCNFVRTNTTGQSIHLTSSVSNFLHRNRECQFKNQFVFVVSCV